jgi:hypothetical protein
MLHHVLSHQRQRCAVLSMWTVIRFVNRFITLDLNTHSSVGIAMS